MFMLHDTVKLLLMMLFSRLFNSILAFLLRSQPLICELGSTCIGSVSKFVWVDLNVFIWRELNTGLAINPEF